MEPDDSPIEEYHHVAYELEYWLASQAAQGVPELALCWLIKHYASVIETQGFIPRSWLEPRWPDDPMIRSNDSVHPRNGERSP